MSIHGERDPPLCISSMKLGDQASHPPVMLPCHFHTEYEARMEQLCIQSHA